jgi:hypothetical protein
MLSATYCRDVALREAHVASIIVIELSGILGSRVEKVPRK